MMCREYTAIKDYYGNKTAKRSGVPLINHINEGLEILDIIQASTTAKRAYCLHPIFQKDEDLKLNMGKISWYNFDSYIILLTMEYRNIANQYLFIQ